MGNAQLKKVEDPVDARWFLLDGGIVEALQDDNFASFHVKLRHLLLLLSTRERKVKRKKGLDTLKKVVLLIKGCHHFMYHKKRLGFVEGWIDGPWLKNPFRCEKKYRAAEDVLLNHHLAYFEEPFTKLSREEAQNFVLAFEHFFAQDDLSVWLNRLEHWYAYLDGDIDTLDVESIAHLLADYEALQTLHEAATVACHWETLRYPAPNQHLLEDYLAWELVDGYAAANPFEIVADLFLDGRYTDIRGSILALYGLAPTKEESPFLRADGVRRSLRGLLEAGWLLLQTDYLPADWFNPNEIALLRFPVAEAELLGWKPASLTDDEQQNLRKTLSQLYHGVNLHQELYRIEDKIINYYRLDAAEGLSESELATRNRLLKILDVVTLIALDLWNGKDRG